MKCPKCNSEKLDKMGFNPQLRKIEGRYIQIGKKQRYICMNCHKTTVKPII